MKKNIIISIIVCLIIAVCVVLFVFMNKDKTISKITMDINPSIEINLNKENKIKNIIALNEDAKEIINDDLIGETLEVTFSTIITNLLEKGFVEKEDNIEIILHTEGNITSEAISKQIEFEFGKKEVRTEFIVIDNVTSKDIEIAKKYNVSPAKISYLNSVVEESNNISIDDLIDKNITELTEIKKSGKYCEDGYTLDGGWCYKEIERIASKSGMICPHEYYDYKGKCYHQGHSYEGTNLTCRSGFKSENDKCIMEGSYDAKGKCEEGTYDRGYCSIKEYYGDAKEYCRITPGEDLLYNGRCLGRKPTVNGGCLNGDKLINGYCYDTSPSSGYKADWVCPDGAFITNPDGSLMYPDKKCYKDKKVKVTTYYCEGDAILEGTKCKTREVEDAKREVLCPSGYTLVDIDKCINLNKTIAKESGLVCEGENTRLKGNVCIIYEIVEPKSY